jgi:hypothetical protein
VTVPSPPPLHDLACVIHLHSVHSDGTGTVARIARAAKRSGVDVVLLTDHDTLAAIRVGEERWHDQVLVLVGEEVTPFRRDHYLAFDLEREIDHTGLTGAEICEAVREAGGFGFAAHPFSRGSRRFRRAGRGMPWKDFDCEALEGIELWSFVTDSVEGFESLREIARFIARPGRVLRHPPEENLREWDRLCASRRIVAIGGLDAHQFGLRIGPFVPFRLMAYRRSFRHLRTHVLCEEALTGELEHDREQVYSALREGRCYIAVDSLEPAGGFAFWGEGPGGTLLMGGEAEAGRWTLHALLPRPARVRLLRDGTEIASLETPALVRTVEEPGAYRLEAYREAHGAERTWILSNPIYLR